MKFGKMIASLTIAAWLLAGLHPADAAVVRRHVAKAGGGVTGTVLTHKGKPSAGAHVHIVHHHKKKTTTTAKTTKAQTKALVARPAVAAAAHKHPHHGVLTAADGSFSLPRVHAGTHLVEAHHKKEGSGHARVTLTNGTANVTIRLHKLHHSHA